MTTGLVFACGGKSHSWLTPTISRSKPRAKRTSVADGSSETIRMTNATLAQFCCRLLVQKIFAADLVEGSQSGGPAGGDFFRSCASLQLLDGVGVSDEQQEFLGIELLRIEFLQDGGDFHSHAHGAHGETIGDAHRHAPATLAAVETDDGDEGLCGEMQAGKMALVQCRGDIFAVEPGSAKLFKRSLGAAADGDAGILQNFYAGIEDGSLDRPEIRRGRNPLHAGALKKIVAMPIPHGNDVKVGADVILGVEELGELANREAVAHRQWKIPDEICFVGVEHRSFHDFTAERIGPIEHEKSDVAFRGFLHAVSHRCRVRVESDAGVLNIEDERVDALEHFIRGTERFAIKTMNGKAGGGIFGGRYLFIVAAGEAVLRTEESDEFKAGGMG